MNVNSKMTALADKIRVLSGTEDAMGLDDMAEHVGEANAEIDSQADLIAQIKSTVDSLPEAGGAEPVLQEKTVTPTTSSQAITPDDGYDGLSEVTVNAIPSTYVKPFSTKSATTYTPTTTNQTISAGTYCSGAQTIKGDANLVAGNIKSGVSIFGVSGTLESGGSGGNGEQAEWSANEDAIIGRAISSYFNDRVKIIGYAAFQHCRSLTSVSFPACTTIDSYAFEYCNSLTSVSFPACTTIGSSAFHNCYKLTTVSFPVCTTIGSFAFHNCYNLTTVSFPTCTTISSSAFYKCYNLKSLYLIGSSLCTLSNSNAFSSTPIGGYSASAGTYGSIYVPASLLTSYQTATNWTYFSSRFVAYIAGGHTGGYDN